MRTTYEGMLWGDQWYDEEVTCNNITEFKPQAIADEGEGWEVVGKKNESDMIRITRWCKHGNACIWRNCPFRHEDCSHYRNWLTRGKRGHNCRHHAIDPECVKTPDEGGCKYDHRDLSKCETYYKSLPCSSEIELLESFYERGIDMHCDAVYDISGLSNVDRSLLMRSLKAAGVEFDLYESWIQIQF